MSNDTFLITDIIRPPDQWQKRFVGGILASLAFR